MSIRVGFECIDFVPRRGVENYINQRLRHYLGLIPHTVAFRAVIIRTRRGFVFSVVIQSQTGLFSSEKFISDKEAQNLKQRKWQIGIVDRLLTDVEIQSQRWSRRARVDAEREITQKIFI